MSEFTPITTQEDLNKVIEARLARQKETIEAKYADYDKIKTRATELESENGALKTTVAESQKSAAEQEKSLAELNTKISGYERSSLRTKIALKNGLPYDLADRLVGDDEAGIQADAERLASYIGNNNQTPPLKNVEQGSNVEGAGAYQSLLSGLNLEGE
ncbi:capsid assembly scaffolding protein Gp46 family protein [Lacticaseibacillus suihuaensis]